MVSIRMVLNVTEYQADVYYNSHTGERAHAAFPDGVIDDVNYDGSIRAFLFSFVIIKQFFVLGSCPSDDFFFIISLSLVVISSAS